MKINKTSHSLAPWAVLSLLIFFFSTLSHQAPNPPSLLPNLRLLNAYIALQAWKNAMTSDPKNFTSNWVGPDVCNYEGVFCAPAPDDPCVTTVAGIDLNHADIAGYLPEELGLLSDLALFHINSNRFYGTLPLSFTKLHLLHELDVSNNLFSGHFPSVVLFLPSLKFLDLRFNLFMGPIPATLFDLKLDAVFLNDNKFHSPIPANLGNSPASVVVLANNYLNGLLPASISQMGETLNEIILLNVGLLSCLPPEIGRLTQATVFDVSFNMLVGPLPESVAQMKSLERLNVAHNKLSGEIPAGVCSLPRLENFTYSYNYFSGEPPECVGVAGKDDRQNCIPGRPLQRSALDCAFKSHPVDCDAFVICADKKPAVTPPPVAGDQNHA